MHVYSFEKLEVWQNAKEFLKMIYALTNSFPKEEQFGLTNQIRRSAGSISACLAEGSAKITKKDKAHYTNIAYASAIETLSHIIIAFELKYITEEQYQSVRTKIDELTNKLNALRKSQLNS